MKAKIGFGELDNQSRTSLLIQRILGLCFDNRREIDVSGVAKIAELAKSEPTIAKALEEFGNHANENLKAPMPYTLADATTEIATEQLLSDPIGALTSINLDELLSPSEWGKDMTDDQREKAQEVVIPVIIASNIVAAAMTRRI